MISAAATRTEISSKNIDTILVLENDAPTRAWLASYLRSCGYRVFEARNSSEALTILQESPQPIRIVLSEAENGFKLAGWVKANRPKIKVILAATVERAAQACADLCDAGPHGKRPYDPQSLVQQIKASLAKHGD